MELSMPCAVQSHLFAYKEHRSSKYSSDGLVFYFAQLAWRL